MTTASKPLASPLQDKFLTASKEAVEVDSVRFELYKTYLYQCFSAAVPPGKLHVLRLLAVGEDFHHLKPVSLSDAADTEGTRVLDSRIAATVQFQGNMYDISLITEQSDFAGVHFAVSVLGLQNDSSRPRLLIDTLHTEAVRNSSFRNKTLLVSSAGSGTDSYFDISEASLESTLLPDVLLPDDVQLALWRFVECIRNHATLQRPMRYLLNGRPGTGKTQIVRAIANEVRGCATFLLGNPSDTRLDTLFSLARDFDPAVICIDDVDLLTGSRQNGKHTNVLGKFLQQMDGLVETRAFVLATTNDKRLVDLAASRPGRFDMIIDIPTIEPRHYRQYFERKTANPAILDAIDCEVLDQLHRRDVTGAFLSNLVKHLEIIWTLNGQCLHRRQILDLIETLHHGFSTDATSACPIGFQAQ